MFVAKIHYSVDKRLNLWLQQCCRATDVTETNTNLVNFASIIEDIQLNKFHFELPHTIKKVEKDKNHSTENTSDENKRKKKKQAKQAKNTNPNPKWKTRLNENWETVFKNKTKDGPTLSFGGQGCLKYHCKLMCYDDCRWKSSHIDLNKEDSATLDKYIK